jgi:hypothetical protein
LICKAKVTEEDLLVLEEFKFTQLEGSCYVGGFIGLPESLDKWLEPKIQEWVSSVEVLAKVVKQLPQAAFAGLGKLLQSEWQYLQRVVPGVAECFGLIEEALLDTFLPALLAVEAGASGCHIVGPICSFGKASQPRHTRPNQVYREVL